jgi:hypothetical protein
MSVTDGSEVHYRIARFSGDLRLPPGDPALLDQAREAVRREFRDSVKWKKLRCRSVELLSKGEKEHIYSLDVGPSVEFDWTWEGSIAFRPLSLKEFEGGEGGHHSPEFELAEDDLWRGEVVEVDEMAGRIFVTSADLERPPTTGSFYVRPFEFLAFLHALYDAPAFVELRKLLLERLSASVGGVHPEVQKRRNVGVPSLQNWWQHSWSVLWGPPGTGKTHTTGQQVARCLEDPTERVLVVSTTNRATDAAALSIGRAAKEHAVGALADFQIRRIGKGASLSLYENDRLLELLHGTETEYLAQLADLGDAIARSGAAQERALLRTQAKDFRRRMKDSSLRNFLDDSVRIVVGTSFKAMTFLRDPKVKEMLEEGDAPFTTVVIDEAGLISRAAGSALSLLAARRVILVGDSKQLAPISRISRVLPPNQARWLASSGLSHLDNVSSVPSGVHVLSQQFRMHPEICDVVSAFQYNGGLSTAPDVLTRSLPLPPILRGQRRAIWYVLDEETDDLPQIRAERGPGNRSWIRTITPKVLDKLFSDPTLKQSRGLFISPFKAQAKQIAGYFAEKEMASWSASTVHSQQGAEANVVIFDTVNAGSYGWPYDEWKRLVNVALSRSREAVVVLASRAEMSEPYLRPLLRRLSPQVLERSGRALVWRAVEVRPAASLPSSAEKRDDGSLGYQVARRKELRPVLSHEQERLCGLELDGKPRLVRGVAGSGKTAVLAHWLLKTVQRLRDQPQARIWAVYANRSLHKLIGDSIEDAWERESNEPFPWDRVNLCHIKDLLEDLLPLAGASMKQFEFDYDKAAETYLERKGVDQIEPLCDAIFIDEAQDMGPSTLKLLSRLVRATDEADKNSRSINIFYDNAQNLYGRSTPKWSDLGLDMRGRSTVMKESFRSTKPITEFAMNVLYRLMPPEESPDHKELVQRGLVEKVKRGESSWWDVRFTQVDGPKPRFRRFASMEAEFEGLADDLVRLISTEGVSPGDIVLLLNGKYFGDYLRRHVAPRLASLGVEISEQRNKSFERHERTVLATTPHSFKGYDAEVVLIPAVDHFCSKDQILAHNLYVAMTRARSLLVLYSQVREEGHPKAICDVLEACLDDQAERPAIDNYISVRDDFAEILERLGDEHRPWLTDLDRRFTLLQEPILTSKGEVVAEPLFWIEDGDKRYACFGSGPPKQRAVEQMADVGVELLRPNEPAIE